MAAPVATARGTPTGNFLEDGFRSLVTFGNNSTIGLWEKSVKPPGWDGGDPVQTSTMHNVEFRTMAPRQLKTLTTSTFKFAYDPAAMDSIKTQINRKQTLTQRYSDGSTLAYYGFLQSCEFDDLVEGTQPEGTATLTPTNYDSANKVEAAPVLVSVAGT